MDIYRKIECFYRRYKGEKRIIGRSVEGRNLYAFFMGKHCYPVGICQYAIHGREWITAELALAHLRRNLVKGGAWVLPLTNPDGALLSSQGINSIASARRRDWLVSLNGGHDFSLWKANADGVDLNVNFDACWGTGKKNCTYPASENYIGTKPFCAPETRALRDFTLCVKPQFTLSYHTKGEEIYWKFDQPLLRLLRDKRLARILSESTGYPLCDCAGSAGGYKDWCIERLKIPAFTVEVGQDCHKHPLGNKQVIEIIEKNLNAIRDIIAGF